MRPFQDSCSRMAGRERGIYRVVRATQDIEAVVIASRVRTEGMYLDIHPAPQSVKCASGNGARFLETKSRRGLGAGVDPSPADNTIMSPKAKCV